MHTPHFPAGTSAPAASGAATALASRLGETLSRRPAGLFCDFDGTISAIVARPEDARILPAARPALRALARRLAVVAIVSGRPAEQVRDLVGVEGLTYIGNHGLESLRDGEVDVPPEATAMAARVKQAEARLRTLLADEQGTWVESKGLTLSIHYRQAADPGRVREQALRQAAGVAGADFSVAEGKRVVELRPRGWQGKPAAVRDLVEEHGLRGIVYAGDDLSDVDVFRSLAAMRSRERQVALVAIDGPEAPAALAAAAEIVVAGPQHFADALAVLARLDWLTNVR